MLHFQSRPLGVLKSISADRVGLFPGDEVAFINLGELVSGNRRLDFLDEQHVTSSRAAAVTGSPLRPQLSLNH